MGSEVEVVYIVESWSPMWQDWFAAGYQDYRSLRDAQKDKGELCKSFPQNRYRVVKETTTTEVVG